MKLYPVLRDNYPLFAKLPWKFLKVSDQIEGGLPHTRGKYIVLPESACRGIAATESQQDQLGAMELLLHEQMHVFQRANPDLFDSLYTKQWGFEKAPFITGSTWLVEHHLANPDALDCRWVFPVRQEQGTTWIWPLVVFCDGPGLKQMPRDFRMLGIHLAKTDTGFRVEEKNDGRPIAEDLMKIGPYRGVFPLTTNIYHPHEASAALFATLVIVDHFVPKGLMDDTLRARMEKSLAPLRTWFRANLKAE
jgi:hypothetical protein